MIRCVDVHKSFSIGDRTVHALRGLDLEISETGFFAIMGRSGSGKSTLMHLMSAMDRPDSGEIHVANKRIDTLSERQATMYRRRDIGVVFQSFNLIPTMNAIENVLLPGLLAGDTSRKLRDRAESLLAMLELEDRTTHRPEALSGGEQQRVAIARALLYEPPVVFADEPTGNLDTASSDLVWSMLGRVAKEEGITVVMITHEPEGARHCDKIYVIGDGRMCGVIDPVADSDDAEGRLDAGGIATRTQHLLSATQ